MATYRRAGAVAVGIGLLIGVLVWATMQLTGDSRGDSPEAGSAGPLAGRTDSHGSSTHRPADSTVPGKEAPTSGATAHHGTESLPQPSTAASAGEALPGLDAQPTTKPLIAKPLPKAAHRRGAVVTGYPGLLAPPKGSRVETTSVSPSGSVLQVGLTGSCRRPCDVLKHYRVALGQHSFHEVDAPSTGSAPTAALVRGHDSVNVVVVSKTRSRIEYALLAVLHAGA